MDCCGIIIVQSFFISNFQVKHSKRKYINYQKCMQKDEKK